MKQKGDKNPTVHAEMLQKQEREDMYIPEKDSMSQEVIKTRSLRKFEKNWILTYVPANPKLSESPHFRKIYEILSFRMEKYLNCFILYGK